MPESRLLDVRAAAEYLGGISTWTLRAYVAHGHLHPVRLPDVRNTGEKNRRLLFDRADLDRLVEEGKGGGA